MSGVEGIAPAESELRATPAQAALDVLLRAWSTVRRVIKVDRASKSHLRVSETASLGDKRFVAVVQVDDERFLIGGAANSVALLARLAEPTKFPPPNLDEAFAGVRDTR